jgi:hypothetical protein
MHVSRGSNKAFLKALCHFEKDCYETRVCPSPVSIVDSFSQEHAKELDGKTLLQCQDDQVVKNIPAWAEGSKVWCAFSCEIE